jgi:hypothetical protein
MIPEDKKRQMKFSVLSLLKENGMPTRMSDEGEEESPELLALTESEEVPEETEEEKKARLKKEEEAKKKKEAPRPQNKELINVMKGAFKKQL